MPVRYRIAKEHLKRPSRACGISWEDDAFAYNKQSGEFFTRTSFTR